MSYGLGLAGLCYDCASTKLQKTCISRYCTLNINNLAYGWSLRWVVSQDVSTAIVGQEATICISCNSPSTLYSVVAGSCDVSDSTLIYNRSLRSQLCTGATLYEFEVVETTTTIRCRSLIREACINLGSVSSNLELCSCSIPAIAAICSICALNCIPILAVIAELEMNERVVNCCERWSSAVTILARHIECKDVVCTTCYSQVLDNEVSLCRNLVQEHIRLTRNAYCISSWLIVSTRSTNRCILACIFYARSDIALWVPAFELINVWPIAFRILLNIVTAILIEEVVVSIGTGSILRYSNLCRSLGSRYHIGTCDKSLLANIELNHEVTSSSCSRNGNNYATITRAGGRSDYNITFKACCHPCTIRSNGNSLLATFQIHSERCRINRDRCHLAVCTTITTVRSTSTTRKQHSHRGYKCKKSSCFHNFLILFVRVC